MTFKWWMAPVIGVGFCALAISVLIFVSIKVRPQKVEDQPYAASVHEDERIAERAAFADRGWSLVTTVDSTGCTLTLSGQAAVAGVVGIYRPDDRGADRRIPWPDPARPLRIDLSRPGAWSLEVELRDGAGAVVSHAVRIARP